MYNPLFFLFSIAIIFLVIEMLSSHFGILWFAIRALISMLACSFGIILYGQIIIFFIFPIILLLALRSIIGNINIIRIFKYGFIIPVLSIILFILIVITPFIL